MDTTIVPSQRLRVDDLDISSTHKIERPSALFSLPKGSLVKIISFILFP